MVITDFSQISAKIWLQVEGKGPQTFKIEVPGDGDFKQRVLSKFSVVKDQLSQQMRKPVNNGHVMEILLDTYLAQVD